MRAVLLDKFGPPEVMRIASTDTPVPDVKEVLIKVAATSINRPDLVQRQGNYPPPPGESDILGLEVAGTIAALGCAVSNWQIGDRVMALVGGGGYAECALARADHLLPIPQTMSFIEAACICESYLTAFHNIFRLGRLEDGQTVLLHGGGGGVCTAGIQLIKTLCPECRIAVTAHPLKIDRVRKQGVDLAIDFTKTPDFSQEIRAFTANRGVDLILDHVGGSYLQNNMNSLGYAGRLVIIGVTGGSSGELNLARMMVKRQQLIGSVLRSRPAAEKAAIIADFRHRALPAFAEHRIVPTIDRIFPFEAVVAAHHHMEEDNHFGKIVLAIDPLQCNS